MTPISSKSRTSFLIAACIAAAAGLTVIPARALADNDPYSFGSGCTSQGDWTGRAMDEMRQIEKTLEGLKDNKYCTGVYQQMVEASGRMKAVEAAAGTTDGIDRLATLKSETMSLDSYLKGMKGQDEKSSAAATPMRQQHYDEVQKLIFDKTTEGLSVAASNATLATKLSTGARAIQLVDNASDAAIHYMNQLPNWDRCISKNPGLGLNILGGTIEMMGALSSSPGVAKSSAKFSKALNVLASTIHQRQYSRLLGKIDRTKYANSMSCIIETTTENFCRVQDELGIMDYGRTLAGPSKSDPASPLYGYNLLTNEVPRVAEWLNKVLMAVTPQRESDAMYLNSVIKAPIEVWTAKNRLEASLNQDGKALLISSNDIEAQRLALVQLLEKITHQLSGRGGMDGGGENFFTRAKSERLIPFFLIGLDSIPPTCTDVNGVLGACNPFEWMQGRVRGSAGWQPMFNSPATLLNTITARLGTLTNSAMTLSNDFFAKQMLVDKTDLIAKAFVDPSKSTLESLNLIRLYLVALEKEFLQKNKSEYREILLEDVRDTIGRISRTLAKIRELNTLSKRDRDNSTQATRKAVAEMKEEVLNVVIQDFNVLMQRDGFLSARLATLVREHFTMYIRSSKKRPKSDVNDVLMIAGNAVLDRFMPTVKPDLASVQLDLHNASSTLLTSLGLLEQAFAEDFHTAISAKWREADGNRMQAQWERERPFISRRAQGEFYGRGSAMAKSDGFHDRNGVPIPREKRKWGIVAGKVTTTHADDAFGSHWQTRAKWCVQALAFHNLDNFADVCERVTLQSFFSQDIQQRRRPGDPKVSLKAVWSYYYEQYKKDKDTRFERESAKANQAERICAFRNYRRRNLVHWLMQKPAPSSDRN